MPTDNDVLFAGIAIKEGVISEEELRRSLWLLEGLRRVEATPSLSAVLVAEGHIDLGLAHRIRAHMEGRILECPSCETRQSALSFSLRPVFRCRSCSTEIRVPGGLRHGDVEAVRERIAEMLVWYDADSLAGQTLGGVQILRRLGQGRLGTVYEGFQNESDGPVAIRVLPKGVRDSSTFLRRARGEAGVLATMTHPNLVRLIRWGEERGIHHVILEMVQGRTLAEVLRESGRLPVREALNVIIQAAQGLVAAHEKGLLHRDIKPQNIFLGEGGVVKIADLGVAKNTPEAKEVAGEGGPSGSPAYLSPEQAAGDRCDERSDIYSLGATFYHALIGRPPFAGESPDAIRRLQAEEKAVPPHLLRADVPKEISLVVSRMVARGPEDRYASVNALLSALREIGSPRREPPAPGPVSRSPTPSRWSSPLHVMVVILIGVAALSLIGLMALQVRKGMPRTPPGPAHAPLHGDRRGEFVSPRDGAVMILVPAGSFPMGSDAPSTGPETSPEHMVDLDEFLLDKEEVSNERYGQFLEWILRTGDHSLCHPDEPEEKDHRPCVEGQWARPDLPVVGVDWYDAFAYAAWAGKRLPSEAERERAARGGEGRIYPWGRGWETARANSAPALIQQGVEDPATLRGVLQDRSVWRISPMTRATGSLPGGAGPYGHLHLSGNVAEWVQDWYSPGYYDRSPRRDPPGPAAGYQRVIRGGSWRDGPEALRGWERGASFPMSRNLHVGFRCAADPP